MTIDELIEQGNYYRAKHQPLEALKCYATAFVENPDSVSAFNNYGNVLRECGQAARAIPFLQAACVMAPDFPTAQFNLAVAYLLAGDYERGWKQYESRWNYEHLSGLLPKLEQPRWQGEDLKDKTILILGEQGFGDNIQFVRFIRQLHDQGATVLLQIPDILYPLFPSTDQLKVFKSSEDVVGTFDYWSPIMSLPGALNVTLDNLLHDVQYITPVKESVQAWGKKLGLKRKLRVGFCWSGRRDSWINQHKSFPFSDMLSMIQRNPDYEWINLQYDCTDDERQQLLDAGITDFHNDINSFAETAALVSHLDVVISVDTAVAHLAGALGRPTWVPLSWYGLDWRWLLNRKDSPWYPTARLFRQTMMGDWSTPLSQIEQHLKLFKI